VPQIFGITLFIAFANAISFTILIPILYLYGREFGLTDFQTSLLFAVYAMAQFFATPVIGKLSDRHGRKPLLIISLAGTVMASWLAFGAGDWGYIAALLFFARFLDGITGGNISVIQAVIADVTPSEQRAKAFGLFGAVTFGLGFTMGPALSFGLQSLGQPLKTTFLVSSVVATIALALTIFCLPETLKTRSAEPTNLLDLGFNNLITGLKLPRLGLLFMINFLIGTTFTIFTFGFQPYFIQVLGQTNKSLTALFILFGIIGFLVQAKGLSLLNKRFSLSLLLCAGLLLRGLTFVSMPAFQNVTYFICVSIVFSIFNALVQPTITTLISLNAKPEVQGMALGVNASYLNVSNAFGPMIAGAIVNQADVGTYRYPLVLAGVLTLSVFGFAVLKRDRYDVA
jgi:MFS family permease